MRKRVAVPEEVLQTETETEKLQKAVIGSRERAWPWADDFDSCGCRNHTGFGGFCEDLFLLNFARFGFATVMSKSKQSNASSSVATGK